MFSSAKSRIVFSSVPAGCVLLLLVLLILPGLQASRLCAAREKEKSSRGISVDNPFDGCVFPPEIIAPTFRWHDSCLSCDRWLLSIRFDGTGRRMDFFVKTKQWRPTCSEWEKIKKHSAGKEAQVAIIGFRRSATNRVISAAGITFSTSKDSVNDPLFYREVNLPFGEAIKDPSRIRWRFGTVSQAQPPAVLENLPVCGNCHSFSSDGKTLGMDVDYANDKGSYVLTGVGREMTLATSDIINWCDYRREDRKPTFGLLSQVSPDGRFVISTVKDLSVFLPRPDLTISQLFFPVQGILAIYSRGKKTFAALPGADDTDFVQSNPAWSPDGRDIIFAKSKAHRFPRRYSFQIVPSEEDCRDFLENRTLFKFDLYRIPFNGGRGGKAEPLRGASGNGMSNYFAKYSPDGKWIVFCQAKTFMLLRPDSRLYILPADGGEPRLMRCNTRRMNSWHSWSSNSRWLVFSSKATTPYTQLFITHVDENGNDAPPVLLEQFTLPARAANIPEFVHAAPGAIGRIHERFIDDFSLWRAGKAFERGKDFARAAVKFQEALTLNPNNSHAHISLGNVLEFQGKQDEAIGHYALALALDSTVEAMVTMANALRVNRKNDEAERLYRGALRRSPKDPFALYNFALALHETGRYAEALTYFAQAAEVEPNDAGVWSGLAQTCLKVGKAKEASVYLQKAIARAPSDAAQYAMLGAVLSRTGKYDAAVHYYKKALQLRPDLVEARDSLARALRTLKKN
jgi:tetratricopeptide (TPR) repeat protein